MVFAETMIEITIKLAHTIGVNALTTFIVLKCDLTNGPRTTASDSARDKIAAEWNCFRGLLRQVAQTQPTDHRGNQLPCMFHRVSRVEWFSIERTQTQNEANLRSQENRNIH